MNYCEENGNVTVEKDWYEKSYQYFLSNAKTEKEIPNFNKTIPIDVPFKLDEAEMKLYERAYKQFWVTMMIPCIMEQVFWVIGY